MGIQLGKFLNIPINNRMLHRVTPTKSYANILKFIREMNISKEDLIHGKVKSIYENIIFSKNKIRVFFPKYSRLHNNVLPNYLKTFNFKANFEILPCKTKFVEFGLDTDSRCNFCLLHADTIPHLFSSCAVLKPIWNVLDEIMKALNFDFSYQDSRKVCNYSLVGSKLKKNEENLVIYLNTITNHKIWKFNMKIQYEKIDFDTKLFFKSLISTIEGRRKMETSDRMKQAQKIPRLEDLSTATKQILSRVGGIT